MTNKYFKDSENGLFRNPSQKVVDDFNLTAISESGFDEQLAINNAPQTYSVLMDAKVELNHLYDAAMLTLQNGYSNEEVKTFAVKQDAISEYTALDVNGDQVALVGLSAENRSMIEALTGSTDDIVLAAKLNNMAAASTTFKTYLALIEYTRDAHIEQLVDGQDNSAIVASLAAAYAALGG